MTDLLHLSVAEVAIVPAVAETLAADRADPEEAPGATVATARTGVVLGVAGVMKSGKTIAHH